MRLNEVVFLEFVFEVFVSVRFFFVMLGFSYISIDYYEFGCFIVIFMFDKVGILGLFFRVFFVFCFFYCFGRCLWM